MKTNAAIVGDAPLMSIVIPTRNRARYAKSAIRSILKFPASGIELVVQDNSDGGELNEFAESLHDSRFKYRWDRNPVDAVRNFERGAALATGLYITFLGDDDGINPELVDAVSWCRERDIDAIITSRPAQYRWPDQRYRYYGSAFSASLELSPFSGGTSWPDPEAELRACARAAGRSSARLPRIYYGAVKRSCFDAVRDRTGTYFPGPSPDLSSAVALGTIVKTICWADYPLFVPGVSGGSMAGLGAVKKHIGRLEDWPHLPARSIQNWSPLVPRFFGGPTIWGEDVVQALTATGREDVLTEFNVPLLHALCAVYWPKGIRITLRNFYPALKRVKRGLFRGTMEFLGSCVSLYILRGKKFVQRIRWGCEKRHGHREIGVKDIEDAVDRLVEILRERDIRFMDLLKDTAAGDSQMIRWAP
jgi:hypothetical protein